jgi:hypothetical protein
MGHRGGVQQSARPARIVTAAIRIPSIPTEAVLLKFNAEHDGVDARADIEIECRRMKEFWLASITTV